MSPRWSSHCTAVFAAALVLNLSAIRVARGQMAGGAGYGQSMSNAASGRQATSTGMGNSTVLTGEGPGTFEVVCPGICYGGAFRVFGRRAYAGAGYYGPFRRYWGYGFYGPNFNQGPGGERDGLHGGVMYNAVYRGHGIFKHGGADCSAVGDGMIPSAATAGGSAPSPAEKLPPPAPNTAHLQLLVPEKAEVLVEGGKTSKTGTVREFVSPPLPPGRNMVYAITVRYTDAGGKILEETHTVRVRANDRLRIDCTKPASAEQGNATVRRP